MTVDPEDIAALADSAGVQLDEWQTQFLLGLLNGDPAVPITLFAVPKQTGHARPAGPMQGHTPGPPIIDETAGWPWR
jgi:hypothetical protein